MFLTIAILASVTLLLPFIALVDNQYLPQFLVSVAEQVRLYLPQVDLNSTFHENVTATDNIIKPTALEAPFYALISELKKPLIDAAPSEAKKDFVPESVKEIMRKGDLEHVKNVIKKYIALYRIQFSETIDDLLDKFSDSRVHDIAYPYYYKMKTAAEDAYEYCDEKYSSADEETKEHFQKIALFAVILFVLLVLMPWLKKAYLYLIADARQFHDTNKQKFDSTTSTKNNQAKKYNAANAGANGNNTPSKKKAGKTGKKKNNKTSKTGQGSKKLSGSLSSLTSFFSATGAASVNEQTKLEFKKSAENLKARTFFTENDWFDTDSDEISPFDSDGNNSSMSSHDFDYYFVGKTGGAISTSVTTNTVKRDLESFVQTTTSAFEAISTSSTDISFDQVTIAAETSSEIDKLEVDPVMLTPELAGNEVNESELSAKSGVKLRNSHSNLKLDGSPSKYVFSCPTIEPVSSDKYNKMMMNSSPVAATVSSRTT